MCSLQAMTIIVVAEAANTRGHLSVSLFGMMMLLSKKAQSAAQNNSSHCLHHKHEA